MDNRKGQLGPWDAAPTEDHTPTQAFNGSIHDAIQQMDDPFLEIFDKDLGCSIFPAKATNPLGL